MFYTVIGTGDLSIQRKLIFTAHNKPETIQYYEPSIKSVVGQTFESSRNTDPMKSSQNSTIKWKATLQILSDSFINITGIFAASIKY